MQIEETNNISAPETLEGWYCLHQILRLAPSSLTAEVDVGQFVQEFAKIAHPEKGWSSCVRLTGSNSDIMFVHFRETLDELGEAQRAVLNSSLSEVVFPEYTFLSVTEAGLYHITAQLAKQYSIGTAEYDSALAKKIQEERDSPHIQKRLYPTIPDNMPYVCFYPMSKRRGEQNNWYTLTLEQRSKLMYAHGQTGRRYAGKIQQVISGAIGMDAWEWGVTLFAQDPLEFKKIVTDMRFDEVSAKYAEFGEFWVGKIINPAELFA